MKRRQFIACSAVAMAQGIGMAADVHRGPITALLAHHGGLFSTSQAGIFVGLGETQRRIAAPEGRVLGLAGGSSPFCTFVGGRPSEYGMLGQCSPAGDQVEVRQLGEDVIYDVAISKTQEVALAMSDGRVLTLAEKALHSGDPVERHRHTGIVRAVHYAADGALASGALDGAILMSKSPDQNAIHLQDHTSGVECLAFSPNDAWLASGARDGKVRLHTAAGRLTRTYSGLGMEDEPVAGRLQSRVLAVCWYQQRLFAGVSNGGLYELSLDSAEWQRRAQLDTGPIHAMTVDGDRLVVASRSLAGFTTEDLS